LHHDLLNNLHFDLRYNPLHILLFGLRYNPLHILLFGLRYNLLCSGFSPEAAWLWQVELHNDQGMVTGCTHKALN
jgi:hypothetical protein